ncbi:MAG: regulatory protein RecX [Chloroflexi bacterium]|nr:MAG: regulatory protein RecX [Chloroflexota bacterium]
MDHMFFWVDCRSNGRWKMEYTITSLKLQERNKNRVNVFLDGEFAFGVARVVAGWLFVGQRISDEKIVELKTADEKEVALQRVLRFLSYRARSVTEVRRYLEKYKYSEEIITNILDRLQENGLLNDHQFAEAWVENRNTFRPRSKRALKIELRQRGVQDEAIEKAIEDVDEEELAYQAALKQSRRLKDLDWQDFRKKLYEFLLRRGFNYETASITVRKVWEESNADGSNNEN